MRRGRDRAGERESGRSEGGGTGLGIGRVGGVRRGRDRAGDRESGRSEEGEGQGWGMGEWEG